MTENNKTNKSNWLSLITDDVLAAAGAQPSNREGADYKEQGNSICVERHPGNEPPADAITTIARIR